MGLTPGSLLGVNPIEPTLGVPTSQPISFLYSLEAQPAAPTGWAELGLQACRHKGCCCCPTPEPPGPPVCLSHLSVHPESPLTGLVSGLSLGSTSLRKVGLSSSRNSRGVTWEGAPGRDSRGADSHINSSPRPICPWLCDSLLHPSPHPFSLFPGPLTFQETDLSGVIMGFPLLVAFYWAWPIGNTCGGRRRDGLFLRCFLLPYQGLGSLEPQGHSAVPPLVPS